MNVCCPHCHVAVEVDEASSFRDITCSSCGSGFNLLGDDTVSHRQTETKTLGHFELIERIGVGAIGTVWRAIDKSLDRTVAVKIPRAERLAPSEVEQFLREARAAAQVRHPNIVAVHEVGREGDCIYSHSAPQNRGLRLAVGGSLAAFPFEGA